MNSEELGRTEHWKMVREDPTYRLFLMMEEMEAARQPALYEVQEDFVPTMPIAQKAYVQRKIDQLENVEKNIVTRFAEIESKLEKLSKKKKPRYD